jgi:hypothetical protein
MQYVLGLRQCGCDVYWMERVQHRDAERARMAIAVFMRRMAAFGMSDRVILFTDNPGADDHGPGEALGRPHAEARALMAAADLLLNFQYDLNESTLNAFRRTALVDIDPGLLQLWIRSGQLRVATHGHYFSVGERFAPPGRTVPGPTLPWVRIRPAVCLEHWPARSAPADAPITTVSTWDDGQWIEDGQTRYENTERLSFLQFRELPARVRQRLELALRLRSDADRRDRRIMEDHGWNIRESRVVAGTPERYQSYVQGSRGEFSCARPADVRFQNARVSDRTLCYLASGKPVVIQDTGPSDYLAGGEGLFRFQNLDQAAAAVDAIDQDYGRHCHAARSLAETHFDARRVAERILEHALG